MSKQATIDGTQAADRTKAHEALLREGLLALRKEFGRSVCAVKVTQYTGRTERGTFISAGTSRGAFDLCICGAGRAIWADAKTGSAKLSAEQLEFQTWIRAAGGVAEPFRSASELVDVVRRSMRKAPL